MQISSIIEMFSLKKFILSTCELDADQLSFIYLYQYFISRLQFDCLEFWAAFHKGFTGS